MNPFFSIIIPVYNIEQFIGSCIDSVLHQSMHDYEIIIIDDGSTDASYQVCKEKIEGVSQCVLISQPNNGLSATRNLGIKLSKGQYLIFLDGDDLLADCVLEVCYAILHNNNCPDIMINRAQYMDLDGKLRNLSEPFPADINLKIVPEQYKICYIEGKIQPWACSYICRRNYIISNNLFFQNGLLHEDELWTPEVFLKSKKVAFNDNALFLYRQGRTGSISKKLSQKNIKAKLWIIDRLQTLFPSGSKEAELLNMRSAMIFWGLIDSIIIYQIDYDSLGCSLQKKASVLLKGNSIKYHLIYYMIQLLGMDRTIKILSKVIGRHAI